MVDYRGPLGLVGVVLQAMRSGANVTEIGREARLPEDEVRGCIQLLLDKQLVEQEEATMRYRPTNGGLDCICLFDTIGELCSFELDSSGHREVGTEGLHARRSNDEMRDIIDP